MAPLIPAALIPTTLIPAVLSRLPRPLRASGTARDGLAGLIAAGTGACAQLLTVVLVTRGTGPETAGTFFAATALCLMGAGILRLDAGGGLVHAIAGAGPAGRDRVRGHVLAALAPVAALSLAAAAVVFLTAADPALRVLAVALPAVTCADVVVTATRGLGTMRPTLLLDGLLRPAVQLALIAAATSAGAGPATLVAAWALPFPPVLLLAALWLRRRLPRAPYRPGTARDLWRHTWPRSVSAALQAVFQRLDVVIVAALAGPAQAAVYTAATRFKVVGQLANQGLTRAVQPRLIHALARGDLPRARELYQSATAWLVVLTWPIWLGYAALAPWLLDLLGDGYASGARVALVLAATMAVATACGMADVVLTAAGHTGSGLANLVTAVVVTVALDVLLIPSCGALGAALGWSAGTLVKNALPLWRIHRRYGLRPFGAHSLTALTSWRAP